MSGHSQVSADSGLSPLPSVGILSRTQPGVENLTDIARPVQVTTFEDAFFSAWDFDAHFISYVSYQHGQPQVPFPRCNKLVLPKMRLIGGDLLATMLVVEYDNPEHAPWTPDGLADFRRKLKQIGAQWPIAHEWTLFYTTRGGARLVYVLQNPIPVDEAEGRCRWLVSEFGSRGLGLDQRVWDWTRIFRSPFVIREGKQSWDDPNFIMESQLDRRLDFSLPDLADKTLASFLKQQPIAVPLEPINDPRPTVDYALDLLYDNMGGGNRAERTTGFMREARRRLKGKDCFDCIFDHRLIAAQGERDSTIHKYVGEAVRGLYYSEGASPAHIYALFLSAVQQLEPDNKTRDWTVVLWDTVKRVWAKHKAKEKGRKQEEAQQELNSEQIAKKVLDGMRRWCDHPAMQDTDLIGWNWAKRRLIAMVSGSYYVMTPEGFYDSIALLESQVVPRIRILGMEGIIKTRMAKEDGSGWKDLSLKQIIGENGTIVSDAVIVPSIEGGYIKDMDKSYAQIVLPCYCRNKDLEPQYNGQVDQWLKHFFGPDYDTACHWLSWALAFEEGPICAMSIKGSPGIGKKMLVQGLAECLQLPRLAGPEDLVGNYQYGLLHSPFLVVNEGWPQNQGGRHPADIFRIVVGGDSIQINRKFLPPVNTKLNVRMMLTANNLDVVKMLTAGRELSPQDRDSLSERLMHFDVGDKAQKWLEAHGGLSLTAKSGARWIAGDSGAPSDFVVARHFLWLYKNRRGPIGTRFLVRGNCHEGVMLEMRTQAGRAPLVIEAVIGLLNALTDSEERQRKNKYPGIVVLEGKVFVMVSEVLSWFRTEMSINTRENLNSTTITNVFRGLATKNDTERARILRGRQKLGRRRWYELDPTLLLSVAIKDGWQCPLLEKLVKRELTEVLGLQEQPHIVRMQFSQQSNGEMTGKN